MRALRAEGGVVTVSGVDNGLVTEAVEHSRLHVFEQRLELTRFYCAPKTAGEQAVAGEQLGDTTGGGTVQRQRDRSGRMPAQMDDVERQLANVHGVAAGQQAVRLDRQRLGVDLVRGGRGAGG